MRSAAHRRPHRQPRQRRVPQRTCVGCRATLPKRQLVRLVRLADGSVAIDPTGKAAGRGAYLHDRRQCWTQALAAGALEHALKTGLSQADRDRLRAHSEQFGDDDD